MLRVGITGGIGSGKSTVANVFATLGVPLYDADKAAKKIMQSDTVKRSIIQAFGKESYLDGQLNRPYIANIVFQNPQQLQLLNSITHPPTIQDSIDWFAQQQHAYALKEAAIFFESNSYIHIDVMIGVWTEEPARIRRVMQRDQVTEAVVRKRMAQQLDEAEKMKRCDFVIDNNGSQSVIAQVLALDKTLRQMSIKP